MGEMRDAKSMETAMHAAETGHLVFSTIHTQDAKQTLDRVMDVFAADMAQQIRQLFAVTLAGIVAQKLVRRKEDNGGMAVVVEVLINSPHMSQLLAEGKIGDIQDALLKGGDYYQMQSFNQDFARLVGEGVITAEEALSHSPNPGDLKLLLRGVGSGSSNIKRMQKQQQEQEAARRPMGAAPQPKPDKDAPPQPSNGSAETAAAAAPEPVAPKPPRKLADNKGYIG
jgi:twitching motility protein PilT